MANLLRGWGFFFPGWIAQLGEKGERGGRGKGGGGGKGATFKFLALSSLSSLSLFLSLSLREEEGKKGTFVCVVKVLQQQSFSHATYLHVGHDLYFS